MSERPQDIVMRWKLWGPNSGGGESVLFADGRIWLYQYGDAARGEVERYSSVSLAVYLERYWGKDLERSAEIIAWLIEHGHVSMQGVMIEGDAERS